MIVILGIWFFYQAGQGMSRISSGRCGECRACCSPCHCWQWSGRGESSMCKLQSSQWCSVRSRKAATGLKSEEELRNLKPRGIRETCGNISDAMQCAAAGCRQAGLRKCGRCGRVSYCCLGPIMELESRLSLGSRSWRLSLPIAHEGHETASPRFCGLPEEPLAPATRTEGRFDAQRGQNAWPKP